MSELTITQKEEVHDAFVLFDANGSNTIDAEELMMAINSLGIYVDKKQASQLHERFQNESGALSEECFQRMMIPLIRDRDAQSQLVKAFRLFNVQGDGRLKTSELRMVRDELDEVQTDDDLGKMVQYADFQQKGFVDESDFLAFMGRCEVFKQCEEGHVQLINKEDQLNIQQKYKERIDKLKKQKL